MARRLLLVIAMVALATCGQPAREPGPPVTRAFYYWRTTFRLSPAETRALADLQVAKLYLRVFDVEWREAEAGPAPIGVIAAADGARMPAGIEIIPVVYLRNDVFQRLPADQTAALARMTWTRVQQRATALGFAVRELQVDCDWTDGTRAGFFAFLTELRAITDPAAVALSATIRLHQVKYRERTGVPPVARGMLMFYNMGEISAAPGARAIFAPDAARRYLGRLADYPLPLDAALPIWSWTVHVRDDRVEGLLQSTDPDELATLDFVRPVSADRYRVTRNGFLHGTLLREGDLLAVEVTGPTEALTAAGMLAPRLARARQPRTISLFDLSERNLNRHGLENLERVFRAAR